MRTMTAMPSLLVTFSATPLHGTRHGCELEHPHRGPHVTRDTADGEPYYWPNPPVGRHARKKGRVS